MRPTATRSVYPLLEETLEARPVGLSEEEAQRLESSSIGPSNWSARSGARSNRGTKVTFEIASRPAVSDPDVRLTAWVHGRVQGVGFRWWTRCRALELGLTGYAANRHDGRVLVVAQGPRDAGEKLLQVLQSGGTPGHVDKVVADWSPPQERFSGFVER